jgi:MFS family permease
MSFMAGGLLLTGATLPLVLLPNINWAIAALFIACFMFGVYASNLWALTQALAGPAAAGRWTGMQNGFGNVGSLIAPALTGWIVHHTGQFAGAFLLASAACLAGACSFWFLVQKSDVIAAAESSSLPIEGAVGRALLPDVAK